MMLPSSLAAIRRFCSRISVVALIIGVFLASTLQGFVLHSHPARSTRSSVASSRLYALQNKCSPLPRGVSPFEKSLQRSLDVQKQFRQIARGAISRALNDGVPLLELDFPPLIGNSNVQSKSQFDDFDNISELNANRDWCVQLAPELTPFKKTMWLIFPDDKEVELAKEEWTGQRYRQAARFTSLGAATSAVAGDQSYKKAWGASFSQALNQVMMGGNDDDSSRSSGILGDASELDDLTDSIASPDRFQLVCQPGNGGPVEDWINVRALHEASGPNVATCVVNGALDKVRNGYYPAFAFPALAKTVPFFQQFQAAFVLKPLSDKGLYGWLYRVYPEPWQVILQTAVPGSDGKPAKVQETVALVSDDRPTYEQAVQALVATAASKSK